MKSHVLASFPIELSGPINLTFDFAHAASAFGAVALNCEYSPTPPEASGNLDAPLAANAEDRPSINWNALISVKTETTVTDVSGAIPGATVEADNAGNYKKPKKATNADRCVNAAVTDNHQARLSRLPLESIKS